MILDGRRNHPSLACGWRTEGRSRMCALALRAFGGPSSCPSETSYLGETSRMTRSKGRELRRAKRSFFRDLVSGEGTARLQASNGLMMTRSRSSRASITADPGLGEKTPLVSRRGSCPPGTVIACERSRDASFHFPATDPRASDVCVIRMVLHRVVSSRQLTSLTTSTAGLSPPYAYTSLSLTSACSPTLHPLPPPVLCLPSSSPRTPRLASDLAAPFDQLASFDPPHQASPPFMPSYLYPSSLPLAATHHLYHHRTSPTPFFTPHSSRRS